MTDLAEFMRAWTPRPDWYNHAACRGVNPNLFHPQRGETVAYAKQVCRGCPVAVECLTYAETEGERQSVWGGLSALERRQNRHIVLDGAAS